MDFRDEAVQILERAIKTVEGNPHPDEGLNEFARDFLGHAIDSITLPPLHLLRLERRSLFGKLAKDNERRWKLACKCYAYYMGLPPGVTVNIATKDLLPDEWADFWETFL